MLNPQMVSNEAIHIFSPTGHCILVVLRQISDRDSYAALVVSIYFGANRFYLHLRGSRPYLFFFFILTGSKG